MHVMSEFMGFDPVDKFCWKKSITASAWHVYIHGFIVS